jgi:hypothetical protein
MCFFAGSAFIFGVSRETYQRFRSLRVFFVSKPILRIFLSENAKSGLLEANS